MQGMKFGDHLPAVKGGLERFDLGEESIDELVARAKGQSGDVIDGLVGIKRHTLPAGQGQRIDHMARHPQEPKLKDLKQTHRPRTDDEDIGLHGGVGLGNQGVRC